MTDTKPLTRKEINERKRRHGPLWPTMNQTCAHCGTVEVAGAYCTKCLRKTNAR